MLICWPDSAVLLGWDLHCWIAQWVVHWGAWVPGSKTPIQANCSSPGSFFSSCRALYDAVHSLKKPYEAGQVYQATINQGLILSKQLFNVDLLVDKYWILAMNISVASKCSVSQWIYFRIFIWMIISISEDWWWLNVIQLFKTEMIWQ